MRGVFCLGCCRRRARPRAAVVFRDLRQDSSGCLSAFMSSSHNYLTPQSIRDSDRNSASSGSPWPTQWCSIEEPRMATTAKQQIQATCGISPNTAIQSPQPMKETREPRHGVARPTPDSMVSVQMRCIPGCSDVYHLPQSGLIMSASQRNGNADEPLDCGDARMDAANAQMELPISDRGLRRVVGLDDSIGGSLETIGSRSLSRVPSRNRER